MAEASRLSDSGALRDVVLAAVGTAVAVVTLTAALTHSPPAPRAQHEPVALIRISTGPLQVRPAMTLGWQTAVRGEILHDSDSLYVPPGGEARVEFLDGTVLELDERSLVVIEPERTAGRSVTLRQGSVAGVAGERPLNVTTKDGVATLPPKAIARVDVSSGSLDVTVKKGRAEVSARGTTAGVEEGARAHVVEGVDLLPAWPVTLLSPEAQHRVLFHGTPGALTLTWSAAPAGARLQLARDRLFAFLSREVKAEGDRFQLEVAAPGVTWWRLVDAKGAPLSEARRFSFVEELTPANRLPRTGEVVLAPPGSRIEFAWTPLPGVSRYRLEVSGSQGFEPVTVSELVSGTQVKLASTLAEGSWFWRVRADDALEESLFSEATRFRLIHKAIPEAPELLNPEVEVTPSRAP